jgi:hypothetical protein
MRTRALAPFALTAALLASACARNEVGAGGTAPVGTSSPSVQATSPAPSESATESPSSQPSPLIEDGRNFTFIKSVDVSDGTATVTYDLAYFLTGDEAVQAAKDHGDEAPPPNDYYIVNDNPRLRTVPLATEANLTLLDWNHCCDQTFEGNLADFARSFDEGELTADGHIYKGNLSPYWLVARDGAIVRIVEQYLP